jgi:hypothetical protein
MPRAKTSASSSSGGTSLTSSSEGSGTGTRARTPPGAATFHAATSGRAARYARARRGLISAGAIRAAAAVGPLGTQARERQRRPTRAEISSAGGSFAWHRRERGGPTVSARPTMRLTRSSASRAARRSRRAWPLTPTLESEGHSREIQTPSLPKPTMSARPSPVTSARNRGCCSTRQRLVSYAWFENEEEFPRWIGHGSSSPSCPAEHQWEG